MGRVILLAGVSLGLALLLPLAGATSMSTMAAMGSNPSAPAIVAAALQMAAHLHPCGSAQLDQCWDAGFPQAAVRYWQRTCPGCPEWQHGNLQCVMLVTAAYGLAGDPLPWIGNARDFWPLYQQPAARQAGWLEIPDGGGWPEAGDLLVLDSSAIGGVGHVAIVVAVDPPRGSHAGELTIAQANGPAAIESFPLPATLRLTTWPGYRTLGYIRHLPPQARSWQAEEATTLAQRLQLPPSAFSLVSLAYQAALDAGISPLYFVRQINVESGFNPDAVSPAGAVGIAQFLPSTAAGLGIDPWNPVEALFGAARLMASYQIRYGGSYAQAAAAYNAGPAAVDQALARCGSRWLACLPAETQAYVTAILAGP
ncbi:transglycosylase SLT domain-containing protein [Thermogemmatispora sp.]|uniref:transglycosylase SLT domain-containing protein n=1 Tax=Thermogemmatispora sp. TaxID=1968838 RepID=UPI0035E44C60